MPDRGTERIVAACTVRSPFPERLIAWTGLVATVLMILLMAAAVLAPVFAAERYEGQPEIVGGDTFRPSARKVRLRGMDAPRGQACLDAPGTSYLCGSTAALALADWIGRRRLSCQQRHAIVRE